MSFDGKIVLITGAGSGIGAYTAQHLASKGCKISLVDKNVTGLTETRLKCLSIGAFNAEENRFIIAQGDLTLEADIQNVIDQTIKHFGQLDILINSAGIVIYGSGDTTTMSEFDRIFDINVKAAFRMIQLCVPHLKKTQGNVVNLSSALSTRRLPNILAYSLSKTTVDRMTGQLAVELAVHKIRVNSVNPSATNTDLMVNCGYTQKENDELLASCAKNIPLGRNAEPVDIAKAIAFLASEDAGFITGVNLFVTGGVHLI